MFCSPIPKSESSPHHLMSACPYHSMTSLTPLPTLQQSYQDANPLVCPGLFFSSAIAENARLEPPPVKTGSTAMFFTPTDSFRFFPTGTPQQQSQPSYLSWFRIRHRFFPGHPYGDISPMIFTDSSFTGLEMRSKKALK